VTDPDFEVIRRAWAAFSRNDEEAVRSELDEAVEIVPFGAAMEGKSYRGHEGVARWWHDEVLANWERFQTIPEDFRRVGDRIVVTGRWYARGKGSGVELDMPATWIIAVHDGKIVSWRTFTDRGEALREIGEPG
jgi:ketosteroid isomerase-like protein